MKNLFAILAAAFLIWTILPTLAQSHASLAQLQEEAIELQKLQRAYDADFQSHANALKILKKQMDTSKKAVYSGPLLKWQQQSLELIRTKQKLTAARDHFSQAFKEAITFLTAEEVMEIQEVRCNSPLENTGIPPNRGDFRGPNGQLLKPNAPNAS